MADDNNWRSLLPVEMQNNDSLSRFKDVGGLAKSYLDMERFVSSTGRVPKDDSSPTDWDSYFKHWGRPEKADGYKVPDLPKEYQLDDAFKSDMLKFAHELGLNQKQFDQMINWGLGQSQKIFYDQQRAKESELNALKQKWGFRFDSKNERAKRTIAQLVKYDKEHPFVKWMESTGNDTNPALLEFFDQLAEEFGEDNFVDEHSRQEASDRDQAARKIREIQADKKHPYWNDQDPRHVDAVADMAKLYAAAYPEG